MDIDTLATVLPELDDMLLWYGQLAFRIRHQEMVTGAVFMKVEHVNMFMT